MPFAVSDDIFVINTIDILPVTVEQLACTYGGTLLEITMSSAAGPELAILSLIDLSIW